MKKILSLITIGMLFLVSGITSAFALFNLTDPVSIDNIGTTTDNAKFNQVESDFYKIYFFASPYYATGATINGKEVSNPLEIADSGSKNPYNQDDGYGLIGEKLTDANAYKYANATFHSGDKFYISAEHIDQDKLDSYGAITMYPKKYFTGYIMANPNYGIEERTSTYVSLTVNANVSSEILSDIIAQTVYKDKYGFGPEFIGWTYDKDACNKRVTYGDKKYKNDSSMKQIDTRGYGIGYGDQIGNYGVQGEISRMTSSTSLYYIDNLGSSTDSNSIDGSPKGDHVIYLYPVFMAKNYDSTKMINGVSTPIVKFRVNPEKDENGNYTYDFKQSGEIDYSKSRFTEGFFQTTDKGIAKPNYYATDVFVDTSRRSNVRIQDMRLDVNPHKSENSWVDHWTTILDFDDFSNLNLEIGYYNFYVSLWQIPDISTGNFSEDEETEKVENVMTSFTNTNKYIKVLGSTREDNKTYGIRWMSSTDNPNSPKKAVCYVIGIEKVEEYRLTGNSLNGSINNYASANRKRLYQSEVQSEDNTIKYYFSNSISLKENDVFSILMEDTTTSTIPYSFSKMSEDVLDTYNNALLLSNHTNKIPFASVDDNAKINMDTSGDKINKLICNASGIYEIMVAINYRNGQASNVSVSYRELDASYFVFILKSKPSNDFFFDYDELTKSDNFLAVATFNLYSAITSTSVFQGVDNTEINIDKIRQEYSNMVLKDTATGWEIKYSLFDNGKFILNRNYVLYLDSAI